MMKTLLGFSFVSFIAAAAAAEPMASTKGGMQIPPEMRQRIQERMQEHMQRKLQETDSNGDGKISREEFMTQAEARFKKADANNDGEITPEEFQILRDKMMQHRPALRSGGGQPPAAPNTGE